MKKNLDHRGLTAKATMAFGYSPTADLLMPTERVRRRTYKRAEDNIPFLVKPIYEETIGYNKRGEIKHYRKRVVGVSKDPVYLDLSQAGGLILLVSPSGAGKTFAVRGLVGDLDSSGYSIVIFDVKDDFSSSIKAVQKKFRHLLPPWRSPRALKIKSIFPAYLHRKGTPDHQIGQISIKQMKVEDLMTALKLKPNDPQAQILLTIWREDSVPADINKLIWRVAHVNAAQVLKKLTPKGVKLEPFAERTQDTLVRKLLILKSQKVFGTDYPVDLIKLLKQGMIPVICLDEDDRKKHYHSTYIAVFTRMIYEQCKKVGKRIVIIYEDAGSYAIPNKGNPSCKHIILKQLIPVGRTRGLYPIGIIQNLAQIPEEARAQVKVFIFFGRIAGTDLETIAKLRKVKYKIVRDKLTRYRRYMKLPNGTRGAMVWDDQDKAELGFVGAPSSWHKEQER